MRVLSLFSGVGGLCSLGLGAAGHDVVGLCEIDDRARSVLRRHHTDTPIWEDVTTWKADDAGLGRVDVVAGGSPCQDLSVAGRRAGLDGGRSGLFWHQCRIADELAAPWVVWENVAGAFSSNNGADFAAVLWGITGTLPDVPDEGWKSCGVVVGPKRSAVWRLLDAQWFGVAQRRRRVFVVGGPRTLCGPEILALAESVSGHPRPSRTPGSGVAALTGNGVGASGEHVAGSLGSSFKGGDDIDRHGAHVATSFSENQRGEVIEHDIAHSLKVGGGKPGQGYPAVAVSMWQSPDGSVDLSETHPTLQAYSGAGRRPSTMTPDLAVRRLTPRECERLMGWPDDHTRWADDGTEIADSHRYRMCGNGVVAPVARWIGERLMEAAA